MPTIASSSIRGLARIRAGRARPGLRAILEVAGRDHRRITSTDLGFILGPRLNAAGRLDDMSLGIECLLCEDEALARDMATQLDELNKDRKAIEQGMQREALAQLADLPLEDLPFGLCLFEADWHRGVIGIPASRLKERYHRPTIAFADAGDGCSRARRARCRAFISAMRWTPSPPSIPA